MRQRRTAFTLVEMLIVVIVLGILAAIVFPTFSSASEDSRQSAALRNLQVLRSELTLYAAHHNGSYPTDLENQMTMCTDVAGNTSATYTSVYKYGPYLLKVPENPYTGRNTVTTVTGANTAYASAADCNQGWWYNATTGEIRCHVPNAKRTSDVRQINQL